MLASFTRKPVTSLAAPIFNMAQEKTENFSFSNPDAITWNAVQGADKYRLVIATKYVPTILGALEDFYDPAKNECIAAVKDSSCMAITLGNVNSYSIDPGWEGAAWAGASYLIAIQAMTKDGKIKSKWEKTYLTMSGNPNNSKVGSLQKSVVVGAFDYVSKPSLDSVTSIQLPSMTKGKADVTIATWYTDLYGRDGDDMKEAINKYVDWKKQDPNGKGKVKAITDIGKLLPNYYGTDKTALVDRIFEVNPSVKLQSADEVLFTLGIKAQCKEFVDRIIAYSAGQPVGFEATNSISTSAKLSANDLKLVTPGMYAFKGTKGSFDRHVGLVAGVQWKKPDAVTPTEKPEWGIKSLFVIEANFGGGGWTNPIGQKPWARTVSTKKLDPSSKFDRLVPISERTK